MNNLGFCGLVCEECNELTSNKCKGCRDKIEQCDIKACTINRDVDKCSSCVDFPCERGMFRSIRVLAFNSFIREYGEKTLIKCLKNNKKKGINYHNKDGSQGHYDLLKTQKEVIELLKEGMYE